MPGWTSSAACTLACGTCPHWPQRCRPARPSADRRPRAPAGHPNCDRTQRSGKRLLTVGTDCALGKKYTALEHRPCIRGTRNRFRFPRDRSDRHHDRRQRNPDGCGGRRLRGRRRGNLTPGAAARPLGRDRGPGLAAPSRLMRGSPWRCCTAASPTSSCLPRAARSGLLGHEEFPLPKRRGNGRADDHGLARAPTQRSAAAESRFNTSSARPRTPRLHRGEGGRLGLPVADPIRGGRLRPAGGSLPRLMRRRRTPSRFPRFLLPGLGVKAVVIGGGYATGRELAEFFLPRGPWGGLFAILFASVLFSLFCFAHFLLRAAVPAPRLQELLQAIARPVLDLFEPPTSCSCPDPGCLRRRCRRDRLMPFSAARRWPARSRCAAIALFVGFGNRAVERLFEYVSYLLYGVYALFIILALCEVRGPVRGRLRSSTADRRAGHRRHDLCRLQSHRRGGDPAGLRHLLSAATPSSAGASRTWPCFPPCSSSSPWSLSIPRSQSETLPSDFMLQRIGIPPSTSSSS